MSTGEKKRFYKSRWFNLGLGIAVTLACFWWVFNQMLQGADGRKQPSEVFGEIAAAFRRADYRSLPAMWGCLALFYWLKAIRWRMLLQPLGDFRPLQDLLPSTLVGFAFNNVLPAHLGEFVRVFVFSRKTGLPKTAVLTSIVLERIFDVIAILTFLMLGLLWVKSADIDPRVTASAMVLGAAVTAGLICAAIYLIWTGPVVALIEGILNRLPLVPEFVKHKVALLLETGAAGLGALRNGRLLAGILVTSFLQWILNGFSIHLALWAFGIEVSLMVSAIVLGVTAVGVTVPSSPGYFGVIQFCFLLVLRLFVDDTEAVFAASIYYHIMQWIPVTFLGMFFFLKSGFHVADVEAAAEADPEISETAQVLP